MVILFVGGILLLLLNLIVFLIVLGVAITEGVSVREIWEGFRQDYLLGYVVSWLGFPGFLLAWLGTLPSPLKPKDD